MLQAIQRSAASSLEALNSLTRERGGGVVVRPVRDHHFSVSLPEGPNDYWTVRRQEDGGVSSYAGGGYTQEYGDTADEAIMAFLRRLSGPDVQVVRRVRQEGRGWGTGDAFQYDAERNRFAQVSPWPVR
jgi:hypothetical protein